MEGHGQKSPEGHDDIIGLPHLAAIVVGITRPGQVSFLDRRSRSPLLEVGDRARRLACRSPLRRPRRRELLP